MVTVWCSHGVCRCHHGHCMLWLLWAWHFRQQVQWCCRGMTTLCVYYNMGLPRVPGCAVLHTDGRKWLRCPGCCCCSLVDWYCWVRSWLFLAAPMSSLHHACTLLPHAHCQHTLNLTPLPATSLLVSEHAQILLPVAWRHGSTPHD